MPKKRGGGNGGGEIDFGLGGIFKGIGNLLDLVAEMAEKGEELKEKGGIEVGGEKGFKAVYGFSVKVGGAGKPIVERFGNVREDREKGPVVEEVREPLVDLFDEGDRLILVAELPGVEEADILHEIKDDILIISARSAGRKYQKELLLPATVNASAATSSYRNGVFELILPKIK